MCFTSAVISSRYCYLYTSKNNNNTKKGLHLYYLLCNHVHTAMHPGWQGLVKCEPLKTAIKRSFSWIYKSWFSSSSKSIYLCFPLLGLSQHHFTSDVAESSVLNGQGYINRYTLPQILVVSTFLLPMLWVWNRFS